MSVPTVPSVPSSTPAPAGLTAPFDGRQIDPRTQVPGPRRRRTGVVLTVVLSVATLIAAVVVAALAFLGGTTSVPAASVGEQLSRQFGAPVSCTEDLPAKVGATTMCTGTDDQGVHHVLVTATSVDGSQVGFTGTVQD
ncbi:DUF4333 domain-containing protein [Actinomycetospora endophytica]|uniref:DUF4333 domain-containing protein n=1 Tax=Actinomycetospora endophytica TaxID=2291215 RepID=A0ABS8P4A9_9PSEU|nr:DUF4333 domain-containing protein [Actinomycetospora endophytica]MCD2193090.1 DUF4333 domain-containing protein [Actinomycetospora endophytica]